MLSIVSMFLGSGKLTKLGWMIIVVVIGIPTIILMFRLVDLYKGYSGFESKEVKLAKSRANIDVLQSVIVEKDKLLKEKDKVAKVTHDITSDHAESYNKLQAKTNKILVKISNDNIKHKHSSTVVMPQATTKQPEEGHIVLNRTTYENIGTEDMDAIYDMYNTINNIGE